MTLNLYRNKYPFMRVLEIITFKVGKRKDLRIWDDYYPNWNEKHFIDVERIEKGLEPLYLKVTEDNTKYEYYIDGQKEKLSIISDELGIPMQSVTSMLDKNKGTILRKGLTITRVKKHEN